MAELYEQGREAIFAGRVDRAERLLRRALTQVAEIEALTAFPGAQGECRAPVVARVRLRLALASALAARGDLDQALGRVQEAMDWADGWVALSAICHLGRAEILHGVGRDREALAALVSAAPALTELNEDERWRLLHTRGSIRLDRGEAAEAEDDFEAAWRLAADHPWPQRQHTSLHDLGRAVALRGDLPQALQLMAAAAELPGCSPGVTIGRDRGRLLVEAGLLGEAAMVLAGAAQTAWSAGERRTAAEIELELARVAVLLGDHHTSAAAARRARRGFGARLLERRRRADLILLIAELAAGEPPAGVARRAARLGAEVERAGDRAFHAEVLLVEAEALATDGQPEQARARLTEAGAVLRDGSLTGKLRCCQVAALIDLSLGRRTAAGRELTAARRILWRALATSGGVDLRSASTLHAERLAQLDRRSAAHAGAGVVLVALERWRVMTTTVPAVRPPDQPDLRRALVRLRHLQIQQREQPQRTSQITAQIRATSAKVTALSWAARSEVRRGALVDARDTVAQARERSRIEGVDLVVYGHLGGRLEAVVVSAGKARLVTLGSWERIAETLTRLTADLHTLPAALSTPLQEGVQAALDRSLQEAAGLMLDPLRLEGAAVLIATERMRALPWGMMPGRVGLPTAISPSLALWLREVHPEARSVRSLAGPEPAAAQEARAVAQIWDGTWGETGAAQEQADAAEVRAALAGADLVHLAARGSEQPENPLLSQIWLADGPVWVCDLGDPSPRATAVVISQSEPMRPHLRGRGQHQGLAAGLLALGVTSVVAPVCPVPATTATTVLTSYHAQLREGTEASIALARAIDRTDEPLAGAYVAFGAPWRVTPPTTSSAADAFG